MFVPKDPRAALCRPWVGTSYTVAQVSSSLSVAGHAPAAEAAEVVAGGDAPSVPGSPRSPRLSATFSGRIGLLASEFMRKLDPADRDVRLVVSEVAQHQKDERRLARMRLGLHGKLALLKPGLEEAQQTLDRVREGQERLRASLDKTAGAAEAAAGLERTRRVKMLTPRAQAKLEAHELQQRRVVAARKMLGLLKVLGIPPVSKDKDPAGWQRRVAHIFGSINRDNSGAITTEQLRLHLQQKGMRLTDFEVEEMMTAFDCGDEKKWGVSGALL